MLAEYQTVEDDCDEENHLRRDVHESNANTFYDANPLSVYKLAAHSKRIIRISIIELVCKATTELMLLR